MKFVVVYGSVRTKRRGIRAARFLRRKLEERGHEVTLVDPAEHPLPLLDRMYKEYPSGEAPEDLEKLAALFRSADGFVIVSGEYNHSVPPALSNLLFHFLSEYYWRPAAIACYSAGPFGGVRAAVHLRAVLAELGTVTIPSLFPMSQIGSSFDEDGTPTDDAYDRRVGRFLDELEWYAEALAARRASGVPYD
jgi:NAD(P)H-dependent FMN reductase